MACSCPGKVLLVGGYLVLDERYSGLVLSLNARIYSKVTRIAGDAAEDWQVTVTSPQFSDAHWVVSASGSDDERLSRGGSNPFVREAVRTTLAATGGFSCNVEVRADPHYYSEIKETLKETKKTGLGSSAALTTSLVGALYAAKQSNPSLDEIHALAQRAHCAAQGKIGSGFDVASAVYGSCVYKRFTTLDDVSTATCLPVSVPYKLLMGDRKHGSSTPGMVKKILASTEAVALFPQIDEANQMVVEQLTSSDKLADGRQCTPVRPLMKKLGDLAGVEVEPDVQTEILDKTEAISGVLLCGVPGAGGYDAIFALIRHEDTQAEEQVQKLWQDNGLDVMQVEQDGRGILFE
ncbi:phosphomevalonate kinase [Savitreella phatthalungensis]